MALHAPENDNQGMSDTYILDDDDDDIFSEDETNNSMTVDQF